MEEALALVRATPAAHFLRGCPDAAAAQLRRALEIVFEQSVRSDTRLGKRLLRGRPHRLRTGALLPDQIWMLVQEHNAPIVEWVEGTIDALLESQDLVTFDAVAGIDQSESDKMNDNDDTDGEAEPEEDEEGSGAGSDSDQEGEGEEDNDARVEDGAAEPNGEFETDSLLDDEMFRIGEMDAFATQLETEEFNQPVKRRKRNAAEEEEEEEEEEDGEDSYASSGDSEDSLDAMYEPDEGDEDEDIDNIGYEDFFVPKSAVNKSKTKTRSADPARSTGVVASKFQRERAELAKHIAELEEAALSEKPWQLKGESMAKQRPTDSLLEQGDLDVSFLRAAPPELTKEALEKIEDVIRRRIAEGQFDDAATPLAAGSDLSGGATATELNPLSQAQSKEGLADVYAKDYEERVLLHVPRAQAERTKEHEDVKAMYDSITRKLDALSNFYFTPKLPNAPSVNAKPANVPAALMEEVTPFTQVGGTVMAAPEHKHAPLVGLGKSREELDPAEKRAVRNAHKAAARQRSSHGGEEKGEDAKQHQSQKRRGEKTENYSNSATSAPGGIKWTNSADVFANLTTVAASASSSSSKNKGRSSSKE